MVTSSPGSRICLTASTACTVTGLRNEVGYTFTVQALTGAGWSAASAPSNAVVPRAKVEPSIRITGVREQGRITVSGVTSGLSAGTAVLPWVRIGTRGEWQPGVTPVVVGDDGSFTWSRRVSATKRLETYVTGESTRSNIVTIAPPRAA